MAKNKSQYDSTLNLPKTLFEMRAGLPKKEPVMLKDWDDNDLYNQLMKHNEGKPQFILHDGPPYANGNIHMGTALNKIIKDIIIREKNMEGFQAPYVPGFDTHGLPIELKALSSVGDKKKDISKLELRQICEKFATEHIDIMSDQFKRLGVIGDFEHPYLTLKPEFEARQIEIFGEMAKKGYIYKGLKPVYWCPDCRTALAEAEIEYGEDDCDSIFVRFHVSQDPNGVLAKHGIPMDKTYFVIWTTTTWTLPANEAICLNGEFEYSFVKIGDEFHIMATELVKSVMDACHIENYEIVGEPVPGAEFELMRYNHVYLPKEGTVILGDHVTLESGSGCVHTAGGHGVDDFNVCSEVQCAHHRACGRRRLSDRAGRQVRRSARLGCQQDHSGRPDRGRCHHGSGAHQASVPALLALPQPHHLPRHRAVVLLHRQVPRGCLQGHRHRAPGCRIGATTA